MGSGNVIQFPEKRRSKPTMFERSQEILRLYGSEIQFEPVSRVAEVDAETRKLITETARLLLERYGDDPEGA